MKINAQELLLINKNMKFKAGTTTAPTTESVDAPVTPSKSMSALQAKGQNNIAFQGLASKMSIPARKAINGLMIALALSTATVANQSCTDVEQEVAVDMTQFMSVFQSILDNQNKMYEQQKITNEQLIKMNSKLNELYILVQSGIISQEDFNKQYIAFLKEIMLDNDTIIAQLQSQGATQKEIQETLNYINANVADIEARLARKEITDAQAIAEFTALLGSIDGTLKDILVEVKGIRDDFANYNKELLLAKEEEIEWMGKLYAQGENRDNILDNMRDQLKNIDRNVAGLKLSTSELLAIAKDPSKFEKLMAQLEAMDKNDIEYAKFEEMFNNLGMNIEEAINNFKNDNIKAQKILIETVERFTNTYITTEEGQSKQFATIIGKMDLINKYLANANQDGIKDEIAKIVDAINSNTNSVEKNNQILSEGLGNIDAKLDAIIDKLETVVSHTSGLTNYYMDQKENWGVALYLLNEITNTAEGIRTEQKVTNDKLDKFQKDMEELKDNAKITNSYLNLALQKADKLQEALDSLNTGNVTVEAGMTVEQYIQATQEIDAERAEAFKEFLNDSGYASLPQTTTEMKDLTALIYAELSNTKDYTSQLNRLYALQTDIYNLLANADFSNPDYTATLDEMLQALKDFKCTCECGGSSDSSDESIKDLEDLFGKN